MNPRTCVTLCGNRPCGEPATVTTLVTCRHDHLRFLDQCAQHASWMRQFETSGYHCALCVKARHTTCVIALDAFELAD